MNITINSMNWWYLSGFADTAAANNALFVLSAVGLIATVMLREYRKDRRDGQS